MSGIFAVSTVLPGMIQHLADHLETISRFGTEAALEHALHVLGCFLVISVLIWASRTEARQIHPLLAYPPRSRDTVIVHAAGLVVGVVLMLI